MDRICDFSLVRDGAFHLSPGDSRSFEFNLNNDAHTGSGGVLVFRMHAHSGPQNLGFRVSINGDSVFSYPFGINIEDCQTVNEILGSGVLKAGGVNVPNPNRIEFTATGTGGRMTISDVAVFFQRDI